MRILIQRVRKAKVKVEEEVDRFPLVKVCWYFWG